MCLRLLIMNGFGTVLITTAFLPFNCTETATYRKLKAFNVIYINLISSIPDERLPVVVCLVLTDAGNPTKMDFISQYFVILIFVKISYLMTLCCKTFLKVLKVFIAFILTHMVSF